MRWFLPVLVVVAGCAAEEAAPPVETASADPSASEGAAAAPVLVAEFARGIDGGWEFSTCVTGEGPPVPRVAPVPDGTRALLVTVEAGATNGMRAGYVLEGGELAWTPVVPAGSAETFVVEIGPEGWEADGERWEFRYQPNLPPPATQECYTGGSVGGFRVAVEAAP